MKIYFNYKKEELMTEREARESILEDVREDNYGIWEFITEHYSYPEILKKLPQDFIEEVIEVITERRLNSEEDFCVRNF